MAEGLRIAYVLARVGGCSQEAAEQQSAGLEAKGTDMMTTKPFYRFSKGMTQDEVLPQFAVHLYQCFMRGLSQISCTTVIYRTCPGESGCRGDGAAAGAELDADDQA